MLILVKINAAVGMACTLVICFRPAHRKHGRAGRLYVERQSRRVESCRRYGGMLIWLTSALLAKVISTATVSWTLPLDEHSCLTR